MCHLTESLLSWIRSTHCLDRGIQRSIDAHDNNDRRLTLHKRITLDRIGLFRAGLREPIWLCGGYCLGVGTVFPLMGGAIALRRILSDRCRIEFWSVSGLIALRGILNQHLARCFDRWRRFRLSIAITVDLSEIVLHLFNGGVANLSDGVN